MQKLDHTGGQIEVFIPDLDISQSYQPTTPNRYFDPKLEKLCLRVDLLLNVPSKGALITRVLIRAVLIPSVIFMWFEPRIRSNCIPTKLVLNPNQRSCFVVHIFVVLELVPLVYIPV